MATIRSILEIGAELWGPAFEQECQKLEELGMEEKLVAMYRLLKR